MKQRLPDTCRVGLGKEIDPKVETIEHAKEYIRKAIWMSIEKHPLIEALPNDEMMKHIVYKVLDSINGGKTRIVEGYITIKDIYDYSGSWKVG